VQYSSCMNTSDTSTTGIGDENNNTGTGRTSSAANTGNSSEKHGTGLSSLDATAQAQLVRSGEMSARELVDAAIERIERVDGQLNAVIHRRFERALTEADALTVEDRSKPFVGVPFVLKDLWSPSAGDPMHNGVKALQVAGYTAPNDSWLVGRYRQAGLIIVGRTATPELGLVATTESDATGATRNPWNTAYSPGGSSGGSAAAVAAGLVPIAHATDGGGSIRIPAAACGLVGLKISQGRITMGPGRAENGLGVEHVVSRTVRDTAAMLDATWGPGMGDMISAPLPLRPYVDELSGASTPLRIGFMTASPFGGADPVCVLAVTEAAQLLADLGHHVEANYPKAYDDISTIASSFGLLWGMQAAQNLGIIGELLGREVTTDDVEAHTWNQATAARSLGPLDYADALVANSRWRRAMAAWWMDTNNPYGVDGGGFDLLLTPTMSIPTPVLGDAKPDPARPETILKSTAMAIFTSFCNVTGQPAISIPLHQSLAGMPVGIQLIAAYGREDLLIRTAAELERSTPWADRRPTVHA
jgi:amidase